MHAFKRVVIIRLVVEFILPYAVDAVQGQGLYSALVPALRYDDLLFGNVVTDAADGQVAAVVHRPVKVIHSLGRGAAAPAQGAVGTVDHKVRRELKIKIAPRGRSAVVADGAGGADFRKGGVSDSGGFTDRDGAQAVAVFKRPVADRGGFSYRDGAQAVAVFKRRVADNGHVVSIQPLQLRAAERSLIDACYGIGQNVVFFREPSAVGVNLINLLEIRQITKRRKFGDGGILIKA